LIEDRKIKLNQLRRIKGTQDLLPDESFKWIALENKIRSVMLKYNFRELRTPVFEQTELFARGIGQLTDIVAKEMYTFQDRGKKQLTLKPEMTAPIMRAYLENKLYAQSQLDKIYYIAPLFRQENPQAGRLRQFHQFGAETLGSSAAEADVEIIDLALAIYNDIGIIDLKLIINSIGDAEDRIQYKKILQEFIKPNLKKYCPDCQRRYIENPMRILDCKNESCSVMNKNAPKISENLLPESNDQYEKLKNQLSALNIAFEENPYLVRGLDYYTRTVFEITSEALGAQNAICGGGRYDLLAEELGGQPTPAVGFASGIERLLMVAEKQNINLSTPPRLNVFLLSMGEKAQNKSLSWLKKIRNAGLRAEQDFLARSVKAQMREANRQNAQFVLLLGDDELQKKAFSVKLMDEGTQVDVSFDNLIDFLTEKSAR
jgi:histidyl-tRNA synthetase